jgi:hypothetical protein
VTRRLLRSLRLPLLATVALLLALSLLPGRRELALHVYALVLAGLALGWLVGVVRRANPVADVSAFDLGLRGRSDLREPVAELERLEREVSMAASTDFDLHFRLRPRLQRIARQLLASRRGVDLASQPQVARRLLGEEGWAVVRPGAEPPADRSAPGPGLSRLGDAVTALERL